jgi:hypothetical protein
LLRDNHVVDTCSRLSSSRLSGVGCMRFALMTKVISTCVSGELDPVDGYVLAILMFFFPFYQAQWRPCSHFAFRSSRLLMVQITFA